MSAEPTANTHHPSRTALLALACIAAAVVTLLTTGSLIGEPSAHEVDANGEGWTALRIFQGDGSELATGTYTVTVLLNGEAIVQASLAVVA